MQSEAIPQVICLLGPTASGKTNLAVKLAQMLPVEIVSVDSVMVYKNLNIGSAKPDLATLEIAPHRLIDIRDPWNSYSAAQFYQDACAAIKAIIAGGKVPLLVGGTMLYFNVLQHGLSVLPQADAEIRADILAHAENKGWPALHAELAKIDSATASRLHPHDGQRIQRALEVFRITGFPISELQQKSNLNLVANWFNIIIQPADRSVLHCRIAQRFQHMLDAGLVQETRGLLEHPKITVDLPAMRSAGYKQACDYVKGDISAKELFDKGVFATRQLAKRQLTWLRKRWVDACCFDSEERSLYASIEKLLLAQGLCSAD